jgi:hypothetical protein
MVLDWKKAVPGTVPALFLHIQKTAGTSIVNLARQYYGDSITSHGEYWGRPREQLKYIAFISGHMGYHFALPLMENRFTFTFLRDPAERILSMYYFCKTRDPGEFEIYRRAHEMDLSCFLEAGLSNPCVRMHIWNNQVWQLAHGYTHLDDRTVDDFSEEELLRLAKAHIGELSYVGFTETIEKDSREILCALGIPQPSEIPVENITLDRPNVADISTKAREQLAQLTLLDRQLYDYALKKFKPALEAEVGE